jgi:hypothetical protein
MIDFRLQASGLEDDVLGASMRRQRVILCDGSRSENDIDKASKARRL